MQNSLVLLQRIKDCDFSAPVLKALVGCCSKTALTIINKSYGGTFNSNFLSPTDLATDSITPLFIKDKSGELPIRKTLFCWDKEIIDESSANYFLFKIVSKRVEQESAKKLKEADPFFGKILRSFNHLVESGRVNKASWFGVVYLTPKECTQISNKPIEPEQIELFPSELFQGTNEKIITKLFAYLETETNYIAAIPLNSLIRKIKHVNASFLKDNLLDQSNMFFEEQIDIQLIVNNSVAEVHTRIDDFYTKKGKFTSAESEIVKKVISNFSVDLQDGGISRGLYEYFVVLMPEISKENFYSKYHQPLDYLLRLLKKEIANGLEKQTG